MPEAGRYLTFDLGAESGRAVLGEIQGGRLSLQEVHRFPNEPQWLLDRFHWDTVRLYAEVKNGLARFAREHGGRLDGIGVDTWGVDYALLNGHDELLGIPYHYRDSRTDRMMELAFSVVPRDEIYRTTGIQFMQLNTLFQLLAVKEFDPALLDGARSLLMMPDLLNYWLTGRKANEFTIATTTQFYNPNDGGWAKSMLERLGIPTHFLGEVLPSGAVLGPLHASVLRDTGGEPAPVIAPATHDTGSAVAGVPAERGGGWAYVSCGTWSLVGVEVDRPIITDRTLEYNLTNEGGVYGTTRLLRNVMGLWLLQQCRRCWNRQGASYGYDELAAMAAGAEPFAALLDPDDPSFLNPPDMPAAIADACRRSGQRCPDGVAATVRCITESLALKYRRVIERLEDVTEQRIETIHVIGGGCQNQQLCQATADASGRRVLAGPVEATALGNVVVQAVATGGLSSLAEARTLIRTSFPLVEYLPSNTGAWDEPYERLLGIMNP